MKFNYHSLDFVDIGGFDEPLRVNFYVATEAVKYGADRDGGRSETRYLIRDIIIDEAFIGDPKNMRKMELLKKSDRENIKDLIMRHLT